MKISKRPVKVIARGLHQTCKVEMIKTDLLSKGLRIEKVINILKHERSNEGIIKKPLPLFMLEFNNSEETKKIYDIKTIMGSKVKIEPLRKKTTLIPQEMSGLWSY